MEHWAEGLERAHVVAELLSHEPKPQSLSIVCDSRESVVVLEANEQKWLQPQVESRLLRKHWKAGMLLYFMDLRELVPCHVDLKDLGPSIPKEPQCWDSQICVLPLILDPLFLPKVRKHGGCGQVPKQRKPK